MGEPLTEASVLALLFSFHRASASSRPSLRYVWQVIVIFETTSDIRIDSSWGLTQKKNH